MNIIFTKEKEWLEKWDQFVLEHSDSHLVYSDWLRSYRSYGFDYEIGICLDNEKIIGGYGAVIAKVTFFKFYIVPYGPIILDENDPIWKELIYAIKARAKKSRSCYCQITLPFSEETSIEQNKIKLLENLNFTNGSLFKYVFSFVGLNWISLTSYKSIEEILLDFKSTVRRDIRSASRKEVLVKYATEAEDIESAYKICIENAKKGNYAIRDWQDIKETIFSLIKKKKAKFIIGVKNDQIKGAIFIVKTRRSYTYIFGGTKKEKPDILIGHLLQWEAIKLSFSENAVGYNISLGGSKGVQQFKNGFNTREILNEKAKYFLITNKALFFAYIAIEKYMRPYKTRIAKVLHFIKNTNESRK